MRIIGIDPGTATTGFGVIEVLGQKYRFSGGGVITTTPEEPMSRRLQILSHELAQIITEFKPELMAVEQLFFATNVTTAMTVGQARGVILLAAAEQDLSVVEFTPLQVKQAVTGYGKAAKAQVQEMVKTLLGLAKIPKPDDAADALAVALAAAHQPLKPRVGMAS